MLNGLVKRKTILVSILPLSITARSSHPAHNHFPRAMSSTTDTNTTTPPPKRLRILLFHGYTQSGALFHAKTRALEKALRKAFPRPQYALSLVYPTGPIPIKPADAPAGADGDANDAFGWWRRKERDGRETVLGRAEGPGFVYEGLERGLGRVAEHLTGAAGAEGDADAENSGELGVDGVIGFSQGACLAGIVAGLLDPGRREAMDAARESVGGIGYPECFLKGGEAGSGVNGHGDGGDGEGDAGVLHPPLKFAVSYSGFAPPPNPLYDAIYTPKIKTPILHFLGTMDTVVEESRSMRLVDHCDVDKDSEVGKRRIVYHPGGHFLPSGKMAVSSLILFIKEAMGWQEESTGPRAKEELDLPF